MKTKILSAMMLIAAFTGMSQISYASTTNNAGYTVLNNIKAISKIEVRGNVELFISDNAPEQVTVYNKYYSESALVQSKNGVLRIASYSPEKLVVWITSESLNTVSAYDNAQVKSFGDVSKIEFNIDLHNNATATLKFNSYSANITLRDHATIEMSGTVDEFGMDRSTGSLVISNGLTIIRNTRNVIAGQVSKDGIAGLE